MSRTPASGSAVGIESLTTGKFPRRVFLQRTAALGLAVNLGGAAILAGCGEDDSDSGSGGTARQSATTSAGFLLDFVDLYVGKEQGFFEEAGVDITVRGGTGTGASVQSVVGGSSQYAAASAVNSIIGIIEEDVPLTHIASIRQQSQFYVTSLADKPIREPSQFRGKSIGVASTGGSTEILLIAMAAKAGVDEKDFERPVAGLGGGALQLAKRGDLDAWVELDTNIAKFEDEGTELYTFNTDKFAPCPSGAYVISRELVSTGGDLPERFLRGVKAAMEFSMDKKNWGQVTAATRTYNPDLTEEDVEFGMPFIIDQWTGNGKKELLTMDEAAFEAGERTLEAGGQISRTVPVSKLLETKYLRAIGVRA